jgi:isopenicillin-N epimerase
MLSAMITDIREQYLLDPEVVFLNHGSFGACPKLVFETYQYWQRELERQPVDFIGWRGPQFLVEARERLAEYLHAPVDGLVYFSNSTTAMNMVARSLDLKSGDEVLTTDHEYPAMNQIWDYAAYKTGARYVQQPIPLPVSSKEEIIEAFFAGLTERTRVLFFSHVTCFTTLFLPVEEICRRAREMGILTIIDGAHAPGHISLHLEKIGADIYFGACHKWLSAPKGTGFLYANPAAREWLDPLVISHGWKHIDGNGNNTFVPYQQNQGTRDISGFLSVPAAIDFQEQNSWSAQQERCHALISNLRQQVCALTGRQPFCPDSTDWFNQMVSIPLPDVDLESLGRKLEEHRIVVPVLRWNGQALVRVSAQAYNSQSDIDTLYHVLEAHLLSIREASHTSSGVPA